MKKILFVLTMFVLTNSVKSQNLDTVSVSLTLRAQDWAWAVGKYGAGTDSVSRARIRSIRTAVVAQNPATWQTNVTINGVNGHMVMFIYNLFVFGNFGEIMAMGSNTAERTTIYTNIRAISNSALQYYIGVTDGRSSTLFTTSRNDGKSIVMDN